MMENAPSAAPRARRSDRFVASLGRRVRRLRSARGLTLVETARRARMGIGALSEIENGKRLPRLEGLDRLARSFGLTLGELLGG